MGHSMGGKTAMRLACDEPEQIERLFVLDVAPVNYQADPTILDAMASIDLGSVERRSDADRALEEVISDPPTRGFLLTNLVRAPESGGYNWAVPVDILRAELEEIYRAGVDPEIRSLRGSDPFHRWRSLRLLDQRRGRQRQKDLSQHGCGGSPWRWAQRACIRRPRFPGGCSVRLRCAAARTG